MPVNIPQRNLTDAKGQIKVMTYSAGNTKAIQYKLRSRTIGDHLLVFKKPELAQAASPLFAGMLMQAFPDITRLTFGTTPSRIKDGNEIEKYDYVTVTVNNVSAWDKDAMRDRLETKLVKLTDVMNAHAADVNGIFDLSKMPPKRSMAEYFTGFAKAGCQTWEAAHRAVIANVSQELANHGGEVHWAGYDDKTQTLNVWLDGNCEDCPGSHATVQVRLMAIFNAGNDAKKFEKPVRALNIVQAKPKMIEPVF